MSALEPYYGRVAFVILILRIGNLGFREHQRLAKRAQLSNDRVGTHPHPAHEMPGPFQGAELCLRWTVAEGITALIAYSKAEM